MARTDVTVTPVPTWRNGVNAAELTLTMAAADTTDKNQATFTGREILVAHNTDASPHNITISSKAIANRAGDITAAIPAGAIMIFQAENYGWRQSGGKLWFEADDDTVKFGVIRPRL